MSYSTDVKDASDAAAQLFNEGANVVAVIGALNDAWENYRFYQSDCNVYMTHCQHQWGKDPLVCKIPT